MSRRNYFKVATRNGADKIRSELFFFDLGDEEDAQLALSLAREYQSLRGGRLSVWRQTDETTRMAPEIGWMPGEPS